MKLTLAERYHRMANRKQERAFAVMWLEQNDPDFKFELAVLGLREVLRKYPYDKLWEWQQRAMKERGAAMGASSVFGAGGGGGSGGYSFTVPQGVSQVQITAIGGGGGGYTSPHIPKKP